MAEIVRPNDIRIPCAFNECDGSGFVYDNETNTASDCRCRPQIINRAKARGLSAVIPTKYRDVAFERFPVTEMDPLIVSATRRYCDRISEGLTEGRGLLFLGPVGTGKTTLAMLATKAALQAGRSAAYYSVPTLLGHIRKTFDSGDHSAMLQRLLAVDLLHLDDLGAERQTPWVLEELYAIVNARYEESRSIVVTTNITNRQELCDQIGSEPCPVSPKCATSFRWRTTTTALTRAPECSR